MSDELDLRTRGFKKEVGREMLGFVMVMKVMAYGHEASNLPSLPTPLHACFDHIRIRLTCALDGGLHLRCLTFVPYDLTTWTVHPETDPLGFDPSSV